VARTLLYAVLLLFVWHTVARSSMIALGQNIACLLCSHPDKPFGQTPEPVTSTIHQASGTCAHVYRPVALGSSALLRCTLLGKHPVHVSRLQCSLHFSCCHFYFTSLTQLPHSQL
jgi:hypothetical protein